MGHKGEIAEEFRKIIKTLWDRHHSYVNPIDFNMTIGKLNDQFSGHNQQEPQELLIFFIDGLHQDLNKAARQKRALKVSADHLVDSKKCKTNLVETQEV